MFLNDVPSIRKNFEQLTSQLQRPTHEILDAFTDLQKQLNTILDACRNISEPIQDDTKLETALLSKINPTLRSSKPTSSFSIVSDADTTTTENLQHQFEASGQRASDREEPLVSPTTTRFTGLQNEFPQARNSNEFPQERSLNEFTHERNSNEFIQERNLNEFTRTTNSHESTVENVRHELVNTTMTNQAVSSNNTQALVNGNHINDVSTAEGDFEPGLTQKIQRTDPIKISATNDKFAGTVFIHDNELLYNDYDSTSQSTQLIFIPDINDPTATQTIDWHEPDVSRGSGDNAWIQDMTYSTKLSGYLLLNRSRLRLFKHNPNELTEFHSFPDCVMKRVSSTDTNIYLVSGYNSNVYNGDEIIVLDYDREQLARKTFREIMPNRINRGAGPLVAEISDIAVISNEQVSLGYRLERRREVGICLFKVLNNGRDWSCIKQLLLDECWHHDLSYTPRMDWCSTLNALIIVEYLTGHMVMLDRDGQVQGECRFMMGKNPSESPINFSISTNNWLCIRFPSSIAIHKITPLE